MLVFERLSRFAEDSLEIAGGASRMENPYEPYLELGGFPLVIRYFNPQGESIAETRAVSIETVMGNSIFEKTRISREGNGRRPDRAQSEVGRRQSFFEVQPCRMRVES